jgi:hypothetical protein
MNRRAILASLLALMPLRVRAQRDPFPLAPKDNPATTCAAPFIRKREEPDRAEQFRHDLIVWAYDNQHIVSAYAGLSPEMADIATVGEVLDIGGTTIRIVAAPVGLMPPEDLWFVVADCGQLM